METFEFELTVTTFLIHRLLRLRVAFPTWSRLFCGLRSLDDWSTESHLKTKQACVHVLLWTVFNWDFLQTGKGVSWLELLRRTVWRGAVDSSLTQIGSNPHDVSLSVLAAVMEAREAIEWAALHHETEYSSASGGDWSSFVLSGCKQVVIPAVVFVLSC